MDLIKLIPVMIIAVMMIGLTLSVLSSFLESFLERRDASFLRCWWVYNAAKNPHRCWSKQDSGGYCKRHNKLMDCLEQKNSDWWTDEKGN